MSPSLPLCAYEPLAEAAMEPAAFAYVAGGAGREITLARNLAAWQALTLAPRMMRLNHAPQMRKQLLGLDLALPALVAPMAYQRLADPMGERAMALAAEAQGLGMVLSCQSSMPFETVAAGPFWAQLYLQPKLEASLALAQMAQAAGAVALVVTVDAPLNGIRQRELAAGFALPEGIRPVMLDRLAQNFGPSTLAPESLAQAMAAAPLWADFAAFCAASPLPVLAKGVLCAADAQAALAAGAAGVIVSNHGGRVLDGVAATATLLPAVRQACPEALLLVDGGLRSGTDLFAALALGADAALFGRPFYFALAAGGAMTVAHAMRRLRDEFAYAMALSGTADLAQIGPEALHQA